MVKLPLVPVPAGFLIQPIDPDEVAVRLVELTLGPPAGRVPDMGGPEVTDFAAVIRTYPRASRRHRPVVPIWMPKTKEIKAGALLVKEQSSPEHAGRRTWEEFLAAKLSGRAKAGNHAARRQRPGSMWPSCPRCRGCPTAARRSPVHGCVVSSAYTPCQFSAPRSTQRWRAGRQAVFGSGADCPPGHCWSIRMYHWGFHWADQAAGYHELIGELPDALTTITGYDAVSLQMDPGIHPVTPDESPDRSGGGPGDWAAGTKRLLGLTSTSTAPLMATMPAVPGMPARAVIAPSSVITARRVPGAAKTAWIVVMCPRTLPSKARRSTSRSRPSIGPVPSLPASVMTSQSMLPITSATAAISSRLPPSAGGR